MVKLWCYMGLTLHDTPYTSTFSGTVTKGPQVVDHTLWL